MREYETKTRKQTFTCVRTYRDRGLVKIKIKNYRTDKNKMVDIK